MGLTATVTAVARGDIRQRQFFSTGIAEVDLDKAWSRLQEALDTLGSPLKLTLRGTRSLLDDDDDCVHGLVPPALVKRISKALTAVTKKQWLAAIEADKKERTAKLQEYHDGWVRELQARFDDLKGIYRLAARKDAYIEIFMC
ncbi:DUF1877 family protein [Zavarzinella formosa]|uniref:DUF1877 family protein n=1 Tax=Zavarzinella formosa TaxID=360055 RepID=UPI0002D6A5C9|nr:DUF1877 family protein [Zavarzinella formosa]